MKTSRLLVALAATALVGCGGDAIPAQADPSKARAAVASALDAWKRGGNPVDLQTASPAIQVADEDWLVGHRLESYEIGRADVVRGLSLQCPAILSLKSPKGRRITKKVTYCVATEPILSVIRQETN